MAQAVWARTLSRGVMNASREKQIADVSDRMMAIKQTYLHPDAPVVSLFEDVCGIARSIDCLRVEKIHSKYMFVCTENRYGDGIVPSEVLDLIAKIFKNGFKTSALMNPACMELPPVSTPEYDKLKAFNFKITQDSAGQLPPYDCDAKFASYTCGHTSMGLRCFNAEVPVPTSMPERFDKISHEGKLSLTRLREVQPDYAKACDEGIEWKVFRYEFVKQFPWVSNLAQEAGNAGQQIARCESRMSLMFKIASIANRHHADGAIDWDNVIREATRAGSLFPGEIDGLVKYVKELSGGLANPIFLNELRDFSRQLTSQCVVTGSMAKSLAETQIKNEGAAVTFKLACMKAMTCATGKFARDGHQMLLKPGDVTALSSDKKSTIVMVADEFLQKVRQIAKKQGVTADTVAYGTIVGLTDVRVVHFAFNKPDERLGNCKTLPDIGAAFTAALATHVGKSVASPWSQTECVPKAVATQGRGSDVKEYTASGRWSNQVEKLSDKGFEVGAKVALASDTSGEKIYELISIDAANGVKLKHATGKAVCHPIDDFLRGRFVVSTIVKDSFAISSQCNLLAHVPVHLHSLSSFPHLIYITARLLVSSMFLAALP